MFLVKKQSLFIRISLKKKQYSAEAKESGDKMTEKMGQKTNSPVP